MTNVILYDPVITDMPETGPPPIYDTDRLKRRIAALPADRQSALGELWTSNGLGAFNGCVTADEYRKAERLVNTVEPTIPADFSHIGIAQRLDALPERIAANAWAAVEVYAGTRAIAENDLISVGRLAELSRIVDEAVAYAASLTDEPTVADLPLVDDHAEQVASSEWPGPKADAKVVMAWVGADRNRAARAYCHEQDRSSPRKGVTAKLIDVLGPDGLLAVETAMAAAAPPPLDLSAGAPAPADEKGTAGEGDASAGVADASVEVQGHDVEAPAVPTLALAATAEAIKMIAEGLRELAEALS
jgi:hypothetical protein